MPNVDEMFAGMEKAESFGSGQYVKGEGKFRLRSKAIKYNTGYKGSFFISEFEVVQTTNPENPVGCTRSYVVSLDKKNRYAFGDIKKLVFAMAMDTDPEKAGQPEENPELHAQATQLVKAALDAEYAAKIGMAADALIGLEVDLETIGKPMRPSPDRPQGGTFNVHKWSPVPAT